MRPVTALALRAATAAQQASRAAITYRMARERARVCAEKTGDTLRGVIREFGLSEHQVIMLTAAAQSHAKALASLAPATETAEPEPVAAARAGGAP